MLQTGSPDHHEINKSIICQSEDFSVDAVARSFTLAQNNKEEYITYFFSIANQTGSISCYL